MTHDLVCSYYTISGRLPGEGTDEASLRTFEARVQACASAGFVGMGFHAHDYLALRRAGLEDATISVILAEYGMRHNEVEFLENWYRDAADPASRKSLEYEETLYRAAAATRAHHMNVGHYTGEAVPIDRLQSSFAALCDRAGHHGLHVALEFMPFGCIADLNTAQEVVRGAGTANGGILIDAWHLYRSGGSGKNVDTLSAGDVMGVQLNDSNDPLTRSLLEDCMDRELPGQGNLDLQEFIRALTRIGFSGPIAVEVLSHTQAARPLEEAARVAHHSAQGVIDAALASI